MKVYKIIDDGSYSSIRIVDIDEVSPVSMGYSVFSTLGEAKSILLSSLRSVRDSYSDAIKDLNALTIGTIQSREL